MRPYVAKMRPFDVEIIGFPTNVWVVGWQSSGSGDWANHLRYFASWAEAYAFADSRARFNTEEYVRSTIRFE